MKTGEGGLLQVCLEGVGLLFANSKVSKYKFDIDSMDLQLLVKYISYIH